MAELTKDAACREIAEHRDLVITHITDDDFEPRIVKKADPDIVAALREAYDAGAKAQRDQDSLACVDMAERYDADIEGCDADQLIEYGEGISCSFRLAYIIKYGKFPPKGDAWSVEFAEQLKAIRQGRQ